VVQFCKEKGVHLVVVGPEAPLVAGLADDLVLAGERWQKGKEFKGQLLLAGR